MVGEHRSAPPILLRNNLTLFPEIHAARNKNTAMRDIAY
jgi:hypothetical protein